jgi:hypothetical protein
MIKGFLDAFFLQNDDYLMLIRTMLTPARRNSAIISGVLVAGPIVAITEAI